VSDPLACHVCDAPIDGEPAGYGSLVFPRGDALVEERPPLCPSCARALGAAAYGGWDVEEEEG